jgi:alpha-tubulin suppressor-like RCC1 family protein
VVQIQSAGRHSFAIRSDGVLFGWGSNSYGVLSPDKTIAELDQPQRIASLPKVKQVASGNWHACAVTETNEVWCWGRSYGGALGNGSMKDRSFVAPVHVDGLANVAEVAADSASAMGARSFFRLHDGTVLFVGVVPGHETAKLTPWKPFAPAKQIVTEGYSACAVKTSGQVTCEGLVIGTDYQFKLGYEDRPLPHLASVANMTLGPQHACVVSAEGQVSCWGSEEYLKFDFGQFNGNASLPAPRKVPGLSEVKTTAICGAQTCAITQSGQVHCWTRHDGDWLPSDREIPPPAKPKQLALNLDIAEVSLCGSRPCFLDRKGRVFCVRPNSKVTPIADITFEDLTEVRFR